jgi:hypothetical protein
LVAVKADLAINLASAGEVERAHPLMEEIHRNPAAVEPSYLVTIRMNLIDVYEKLGNSEQVADVAKQLVATVAQIEERDHSAFAAMLARFGLTLLKYELFSDAEPILRESLQIRERDLPDHWVRYNTMSMLGAAIFGSGGDPVEAEQLLLDGYLGMRERRDSIPPSAMIRLDEAQQRLERRASQRLIDGIVEAVLP